MGIKKIALTGLGAFGLSKKKAGKLVKEFEKQGSLAAAEGKKIANQLLAESSKHGLKLRKLVAAEVEKALKRLGVATKKDLEKLKKDLKRNR